MWRAVLILIGVLVFQSAVLADSNSFPVIIAVDAGQKLGELRPIWRFFGYDECNFTYSDRGRQLLGELGQLGPQQVYIRCHHLLTSGDGTPAMKWGSTGIYHEDAAGNPVYDWTIVDRIFDTYQANHLKPYVEIGFMPKDLSTRPDLYPAKVSLDRRIDVAAGQAYPPKDFGKWGELVYRWVDHCVKRYGKDEVQSWYWEVWNEPNIAYWKGTTEQYYQLYDYAVAGVRRALPEARVGGNEAAGSDRSLRAFLQHCVSGRNDATGKIGSPIDFISFHAKGMPGWSDGHVQMGISPQLKAISACMSVVASFPTLKDKPIVIGESDPDGMAARPIAENAGLGYRNTTQFPAYTAACLARELQMTRGYGVNLQGALTWSFEFEHKPLFAGYRVLSSNGVDLPILNLFRMMGKMGGEQVSVRSDADPGLASDVSSGVRGQRAEVSAIASLRDGGLDLLIFHYHDDDVDSPQAAVQIEVEHLPVTSAEARLVEYRIDRDHSDAVTVWRRMGSTSEPTAEQYEQLQRAALLSQVGEGRALRIESGKVEMKVALPRESVALLLLRWR